jgi:hypothetical protein
MPKQGDGGEGGLLRALALGLGRWGIREGLSMLCGQEILIAVDTPSPPLPIPRHASVVLF